ncbi:MAG: hypothetical protein JSR82_03275 [Verrucomicrobia bacterium]|nr:hypothetical protein [Verrucomicrobiota bacterium]
MNGEFTLNKALRRKYPAEKIARAFNEAKGGVNDAHQYLIEVMQPIDEVYTEKTFREAERVKAGLTGPFMKEFAPSFEYQGSVTNDTHIIHHSDIDLLALHGGFVSLESAVEPPHSPPKTTLTELSRMRSNAALALPIHFPNSKIDASPGKAIALSGGSLERKIDVVISNWWNTPDYLKHGRIKVFRGINVLDSRQQAEIRNKPFYHNFQLDYKDKKTAGLRKVIRLLKSLKADLGGSMPISSYDIASVAWNFADEALTVQPDSYLQLATQAHAELNRFVENTSTRESLWVPNYTRRVFCAGGASLTGLVELRNALGELLRRIAASPTSSLVKLAEKLTQGSSRRWLEARPPSVVANSF